MRRRLLVISAAGIVCFGTLIVAVCWCAAGWLIAPPRKLLESYHQQWIAESRSAHGLRVERSVTASGIPFLLCEPDGVPGKRGSIIRDQLRARGVRLSPFGETAGTLVLLHGRGCRKEDLLLTAERFCAAGLRCLLPDLPAHGENSAKTIGFGTRMGEKAIAREVLRSASTQFGFPRCPAGLWGVSMGGAYAIEAAAEKPALWSAVVVVSSFDSLERVVDARVNRWGAAFGSLAVAGVDEAVQWRAGFSLSKVRPVERAASLPMPVMIVHGTDDEVVAYERGRGLFKSLSDPQRARWVEVAGARHGNVLVTPMPVFAEMAAWYLTWFDLAAGGHPKAEKSLAPTMRPSQSARACSIPDPRSRTAAEIFAHDSDH